MYVWQYANWRIVLCVCTVCTYICICAFCKERVNGPCVTAASFDSICSLPVSVVWCSVVSQSKDTFTGGEFRSQEDGVFECVANIYTWACHSHVRSSLSALYMCTYIYVPSLGMTLKRSDVGWEGRGKPMPLPKACMVCIYVLCVGVSDWYSLISCGIESCTCMLLQWFHSVDSCYAYVQLYSSICVFSIPNSQVAKWDLNSFSILVLLQWLPRDQYTGQLSDICQTMSVAFHTKNFHLREAASTTTQPMLVCSGASAIQLSLQ